MAIANPYALPAGTEIGGYELVRVLGAGGFGITYEAVSPFTGKRWAIKEFFPQGLASREDATRVVFATDRDIIQRALTQFERSTRKLCELQHPNIVNVIHYIKENATGYMIMDYVEGPTFEAWLLDRLNLPALAELRAILDRVFDALEYAHACNTVHRDIAPDNIVVRKDGTPVLIDFGALKVISPHTSAQTSSLIVRKRYYSPPEQSEAGLDVRPSSDVYSIAAVLYRALTGAPPADADERKHAIAFGRGDSYVSLESYAHLVMSPAIRRAIDRALSFRASDRPQTIREFVSGLDWQERPVRVTAPERIEPTAQKTGRKFYHSDTKAMAAVVGIAALAVIVAIMLRYSQQTLPPEPPPAIAQTAPETQAPVPIKEMAGTKITTALRPKDVFKECRVCPDMVVVPEGSFVIGSPTGEPERNSVEGPQRQVALVRPFSVSRFAVTFDEWDACVAEGGCNRYRPEDRGWGRGKRPVINVSWSDAKLYTTWLSRKTGSNYRLLGEAEREYVTRAGTTTPFWWGQAISPDQANYNGTFAYNHGAVGGYRGRTVPVNSFRANPWGLYQVHGNVLEWTEDCWNESYNGAPSDGSVWSSGDCTRRVLRGGSWSTGPSILRAANRFFYGGDLRDSNFGFRVSRELIDARESASAPRTPEAPGPVPTKEDAEFSSPPSGAPDIRRPAAPPAEGKTADQKGPTNQGPIPCSEQAC